MVRSQRQEHDARNGRGRLIRRTGCQQALNGVQDTGRVVHRAVGIRDDGKAVLLEFPSYPVGEARANQQYLLTGPDLKGGMRYIDNRSELHNTKIYCKDSVKKDKYKEKR